MPIGNVFIEFPDDLLRAFDHRSKQRVVAFVGSGPSCHVGLPSWSDLLRRIAVEVGLDQEIESYLARNEYLKVAEFLAQEREERVIKEKAAKHIRQASGDPGDLHKLIVSLPLAGIITTNYDHLLTSADELRLFPPPITHKTGSLRSNLTDRFLLHLHGHIGDPETIVLTRHGYDQIKFESAGVRQFLSTVFQTHIVLFIGFGFADDHIDNLLGEFKDFVVGESSLFALIPTSSPDSPDRVLDKNLRSRLINPLYLKDTGDYGVSNLRVWLESLRKALKRIALSSNQSVRSLRPKYLIDGLHQLFISDDYFAQLTDVLRELPNRPDLKNLVRLGLSKRDVKELFGKLGLSEMRFILMTLNKARRDPKLEDALSCFPPMPEEPEF